MGSNNVFKNKNQARQHLISLGYKVSNGNFYKHTNPPPKGDGLLRVNPDGSISEDELLVYAQAHLKLNPADAKGAGKTAGTSEKLVDAKLEGQKLKNQSAEVRLLRDMGQLIPKDEHKQELVRTVVLIKNTIFEMCSKAAPALVQAAGQQNAASLVEDELVKRMSKVFNDLAKPSTFYEVLDSEVKAMLEQLEGAGNG